MRLREVGERVEELIDSAWDELMLGPFSNGLLNEPKTLPACYRQATTGVKGAGSVGWQVLEFAPDAALIEPFRLIRVATWLWYAFIVNRRGFWS